MEKFKHYNISNVGEVVTLTGWVSKVRNLGGLVFIDLRNRTGIMQVVVRPENEYYSIAESLKNEYVIEVTGKIVERERNKARIPANIPLYEKSLSVLMALCPQE